MTRDQITGMDVIIACVVLLAVILVVAGIYVSIAVMLAQIIMGVLA